LGGGGGGGGGGGWCGVGGGGGGGDLQDAGDSSGWRKYSKNKIQPGRAQPREQNSTDEVCTRKQVRERIAKKKTTAKITPPGKGERPKNSSVGNGRG